MDGDLWNDVVTRLGQIAEGLMVQAEGLGTEDLLLIGMVLLGLQLWRLTVVIARSGKANEAGYRAKKLENEIAQLTREVRAMQMLATQTGRGGRPGEG